MTIEGSTDQCKIRLETEVLFRLIENSNIQWSSSYAGRSRKLHFPNLGSCQPCSPVVNDNFILQKFMK